MNHTIHGYVQHSSELISRNGNCGLDALSEERMEAKNKDELFAGEI